MKYKNILIYTTPRSGSNFLQWTLVRSFQYCDLDNEMFLDESDIDSVIDRYNFKAGGSEPVVLRLMVHKLDNLSKDQIDRLKLMLDNHDFFIIKLTRDSLREQVLSMYIASELDEFTYQSSKKIQGTYEALLNIFNETRYRYFAIRENKYEIPIHQEISYEKLIADGITIDGFVIKVDINTQLVSKSLPKINKIENYSLVQKWYEKIIKKYGYKTP